MRHDEAVVFSSFGYPFRILFWVFLRGGRCWHCCHITGVSGCGVGRVGYGIDGGICMHDLYILST
jgi:hypothetical protein